MENYRILFDLFLKKEKKSRGITIEEIVSFYFSVFICQFGGLFFYVYARIGKWKVLWGWSS